MVIPWLESDLLPLHFFLPASERFICLFNEFFDEIIHLKHVRCAWPTARTQEVVPTYFLLHAFFCFLCGWSLGSGQKPPWKTRCCYFSVQASQDSARFACKFLVNGSGGDAQALAYDCIGWLSWELSGFFFCCWCWYHSKTVFITEELCPPVQGHLPHGPHPWAQRQWPNGLFLIPTSQSPTHLGTGISVKAHSQGAWICTSAPHLLPGLPNHSGPQFPHL